MIFIATLLPQLYGTCVYMYTYMYTNTYIHCVSIVVCVGVWVNSFSHTQLTCTMHNYYISTCTCTCTCNELCMLQQGNGQLLCIHALVQEAAITSALVQEAAITHRKIALFLGCWKFFESSCIYIHTMWCMYMDSTD